MAKDMLNGANAAAARGGRAPRGHLSWTFDWAEILCRNGAGQSHRPLDDSSTGPTVNIGVMTQGVTLFR